MTGNAWQSIFAQSPVNSGYYDEDELPHCTWDWPNGTWFQARRDFVRERRSALRGKNQEKFRAGNNVTGKIGNF